ncbi:MAG: DNA-packaging protein [Paracoccaceae bacterium]
MHLFEFWAHPHQRPPGGDWRTWVILGGRGAGKTRAGAEWVRSLIGRGRAGRVALVAATIDQGREVMVLGDSGLLATAPPAARPVWHAGRKLVEWPSGQTAQLFSAHDPESLRGPQFDAAWADELAKWPRARETWDMLQMALRLGDDPRACVTTTPRDVEILRHLLDSPSTVRTHAPSEANAAHLAPGFLAEMRARYGGSRLGRQELDGVLLGQVEGTLWPRAVLDAARARPAPVPERVVVALDPAVTAGGDATGIVVAGARHLSDRCTWEATVIADATVTGASPHAWALAAVDAWRAHRAQAIVAEVNQGGEMVRDLIAQIDPLVPVIPAHATRGKVARAEPVAALYEQGRVHHAPGLDELEDQMGRMTRAGYAGTGSPDRVDAAVWALTALLPGPAPRLRAL